MCGEVTSQDNSSPYLTVTGDFVLGFLALNCIGKTCHDYSLVCSTESKCTRAPGHKVNFSPSVDCAVRQGAPNFLVTLYVFFCIFLELRPIYDFLG